MERPGTIGRRPFHVFVPDGAGIEFLQSDYSIAERNIVYNTSNWSQHRLTPQQMLYAANDAYAALKVLEALDLPREDLPIMGLAVQDAPPPVQE